MLIFLRFYVYSLIITSSKNVYSTYLCSNSNPISDHKQSWGQAPRCDGWRDSDGCPHGYRSFSLLHLFRYYILICILMMIFLGRMLKE